MAAGLQGFGVYSALEVLVGLLFNLFEFVMVTESQHYLGIPWSHAQSLPARRVVTESDYADAGGRTARCQHSAGQDRRMKHSTSLDLFCPTLSKESATSILRCPSLTVNTLLGLRMRELP